MKSVPHLFRCLAALALALTPVWASAHPGHADFALRDGFLHPWLGFDHLLAMLAVGVWAAQRERGAAMLRLPALFVLAVALGGLGGVALGALSGGEALIAATLIALGALLAARQRLPAVPAAVLVLAMGLVHGWAHGAEMPTTADALPYFSGFLSATVMLHGSGLAATTLIQRHAIALRSAGIALAAVGVGLLTTI